MPKNNVKNLKGTSHLRPAKGTIGGWKGHHEKYSKTKFGKCAAKGCGKFATVGAHVEIDTGKSHTRNRHIVPFCQRHNKWNTDRKGSITVKPNTYLVSVQGGKITKLY
jgi:hypothetical protein